MGNSEVRLPDGYVRLNYVEATGQQYVITDYTPTNTKPKKIVADFQFTVAKYQFLFGKASRVTNTGNFIFGRYQGGDYAFIRAAGGSNNTEQPATFIRFGADDLERHVFEYIYKSGVYIDGVIYPEPSAQTFFTSWGAQTIAGNEFALFARQRAGQIDSAYYANARLYDFRIYEDTGLVRRFIPAQKVDTGEIGLYEIKKGKFYKSGTSTPLLGG